MKEAVMLNAGEMVGATAVAALVAFGAWHVARRLLALRGTRLVTCPDNGRTVAVDLDLKFSAVHSAVGRPHFRLKDCSRWPEKAGCGQMCLGDLEAAPHDCLVRTIASRWYEGKRCAFCRRTFGEVHWHDHKPALLDDQGITRQWNELPPASLPELLAGHQPVCWNCHIAETFRRERPDLVVERPARPVPPLF
jgi:hypothetical protein